MENNIGYSLGLVEGFLERLVIDGNTGAAIALEHFHAVEAEYREVSDQVRTHKTKLDQLQQMLREY
jgi:hypothetical protein